MSALVLQHRGLQVPLVLGIDRVRGMVRERAVELREEVVQLTGSRAITAGATSPPIPFAVSIATVSGRMREASTNVSTCST